MNFNYKKMTRLIAVLLVALFSLPTFAQNVDCTGIADWTSQSYSGGQEVVLNGKLYKANWWTQTNPANDNGVEGSGKSWTLLGDCGVSTPEISISSLVNNQEVYLSTSQTQALEVSSNVVLDSVRFIVVDILCHQGGCVDVNRYNVKSSPFSYDLSPNFAAIYTQISVVGFKDGQGFNGNTVDVTFNQTPQINITSPGNTQPFHLDAEAGETVPLSVVIDTAVDSVQYVVVDILCNGPGCASVNKYTVTSAPYTYNLTPTYGASYTDITAIAFKNGQGYSSPSVETYFNALPKVELTSVASGYFKSGQTLPMTVDVNDEVAQIDSVYYIVVNVLCNGPGCADVKRYTVTTAPYNFDLVPTFGASYSEVTALAYANGIGANSATVSFFAKALPELRITNLPETGGLVYVDGTNSYSFDVNIDVNDEDVAIDSVEYILVQIEGTGNSTRYHEIHKIVTEAPYTVTFDETEAFLGQNWTRVVAIPYGDEGKTAGSQSVLFDLIANPTVQITSLVDGQYHYLKASQNPTVDVEVAVNGDVAQIDSVYYIVVDLLCNGPGCANVRRFTKTEAPYTLTLDPIFGGSYTEIYAIAFSNGRSSDASYSIDNYFVALPEATFLNIVDEEDYVVDGNNPEIFVDIDVNDELIQIDSVQYVLVQHSGFGPHPTVRELYKTVTTAPFDITFDSSEVYLDQNWTLVVAIPFGDGGKTAGSVTAKINVIAEVVNTCNVAAWVSGTEYCGGTEVSHNGIVYVADWCTTNEPGTGQWIGWTSAGACGSARIATTSSVNVSVYPNPVVNALTISNADNFTSYVIVDVLGNVVVQGSVNGTIDVNTSNWKSGTYVVRLIGETNENISIVK